MLPRFQLHTWRILALGWLIFTTILLVIPGDALPKTNLVTIPSFDKLIHVGLFAVLSLLSFKAIKAASLSRVLGLLLMIIGYGIAMEYVQRDFVENRSFDMVDIVADLLGAILGRVIYYYSAKKSSS